MAEVRLFHTDGKGNIIHETWDKPEPDPNAIEVKSIFTGVCRSDIDMHVGAFQLLPKQIQGHESLGIVTKVGKLITSVKEGDYVATRGEPAFADYYNCPQWMFVKVPAAEPKYILEPVACAINIARGLDNLKVISDEDILLFGSGFLATIVVKMLNRWFVNKVVVIGNANKEYWKSQNNVELSTAEEIRNKKFKYIIDLSDKPEYLNLNVYQECAKIVLAAEKHPKANTSFAEFLWNAVDLKFPSPRDPDFYRSLEIARDVVESGDVDVSQLWTKSYDRETQVELAFEEGINRPVGYSRGYIEWRR